MCLVYRDLHTSAESGRYTEVCYDGDGYQRHPCYGQHLDADVMQFGLQLEGLQMEFRNSSMQCAQSYFCVVRRLEALLLACFSWAESRVFL